MSNRIIETFSRLSAERRTALIPYVTCGDPDLVTTGHVLDALVHAGCDLIELGVPFSDPMADGPVIQAAMDRALASGTTFDGVLDTARAFRGRHPDVPLVLFGYLNPFFRRGLAAMCQQAADAGVDGLLVVDLPPEEADQLAEPARQAGLALISLFTPTTDDHRLDAIRRLATGFAYCVSMPGVTGGRTAALPNLDTDVATRVTRVREATGLPVAVGFGVRAPEDAVRIAAFADGVVIGSALVAAMASGAPVESPTVAEELMGRVRRALDAGPR